MLNCVFISYTVPPGFTSVNVCLDVNVTRYTELDIYYSVSSCGKIKVMDRYVTSMTKIILSERANSP